MDELFAPSLPAKMVGFAENIPGNKSTYVFSDERTYLDHYRRSLFCVTRKKTGWDSGRHLEIIGSGCVPYFVDLGQLPARTLALYPRDMMRRAMRLAGVEADQSGGKQWFLQRNAFRLTPAFNYTEYLQVERNIRGTRQSALLQ
eukprot:5392699-Prymnesium_polylepis.1